MKSLIFASFLLLITGCSFDSPTESMTDVLYSEDSMVYTATSASADFSMMSGSFHAHDSLKHMRMFQKLKDYVGLTDTQVAQVKVFADTLFSRLKAIKQTGRRDSLSRDSVKSLVKLERDNFINSVKSILTADQLVKFEEWITKFWDNKNGLWRPRGHRGHGHGGHGGGH